MILGTLLGCLAIHASAQTNYAQDRVYTGNQVSNTVSVVDPSTNKFLGEIKLGAPYPNVLSPLYKGQALVHGLRYSPKRKLLAVVSIGSNAVTFVSTEDNKVLKTVYVGRSPHEPTFTPDSRQVWVSVRGEAYISVIDVDQMAEIRRVPVADGPGMVAFSPDGKLAYVCSSFAPELDIVNTSTYQIVKKIQVTSPFSPNIFTSPDGRWVAMTHKDVGKVTVIDTKTQTVKKVIPTGPITNHVTFTNIHGHLTMLVTVGGENKVKVFDPAMDFSLTDSVVVGALPHGLWASADGNHLFVGLEYADEIQSIDLQTLKASKPVKIGQSPQALVYADKAVVKSSGLMGLTPLADTSDTRIITLKGAAANTSAIGRLAVRPIGIADLVEQIFSALRAGGDYTLALTRSEKAPYKSDYEINSFKADPKGKYSGQSTGLVKNVGPGPKAIDYKHIILIDQSTGETVLID